MSLIHDRPSWEILTCIRYDPQLKDECDGYYMLSYHQARMLAAAEDFGWEEGKEALKGPDGLNRLTNAINSHIKSGISDETIDSERSYKLRVLLSPGGRLTVSSSGVEAVARKILFPTTLWLRDYMSNELGLPLKWRIYISPICTVPSLHTTHKTTQRSLYDEARKYIPVPDRTSDSSKSREILVVNEKGEIMEGSITTPYFFRDGRWVTPPQSAGGNLGTTRRWALEKGLCVEETIMTSDIMKSDVKAGELIWLSNGVKGWGLGTVHDI